MAGGRARAVGRYVPLAAAALLLLLPFPVGGAASIGAAPGRIDLGDVARGAEVTVDLVFRNGGDTATGVTFAADNAEEATLLVDPTTAELDPGDSVTVRATLRVPADAVPGRHAPSVVAAGTATGGGNAAAGAVSVPLPYNVPAFDVAYAAIVGYTTLHLRVVNGHNAPRTADVHMETRQGATIIETQTLAPAPLAGYASRLADVPLNGTRYADGTYVLRLTGTATGGAAPEPYEAQYALYAAGGVLSLEALPAPAGGGGCVPGAPCGNAGSAPVPEASTPTPTGGPIPVQAIDNAGASTDHGNAPDGTAAGGGRGDPPRPGLPNGSAPTASLLGATAVALTAGVLLSLGRRGLGP